MFNNSTTSAMQRVILGCLLLALVSSICLLEIKGISESREPPVSQLSTSYASYEIYSSLPALDLLDNNGSISSADIIIKSSQAHNHGKKRRLLVAVKMDSATIGSSWDTRNMLRVAYNDLQRGRDLGVDVCFEFPKPVNQMEKLMFLMEQRVHGDVVVSDCLDARQYEFLATVTSDMILDLVKIDAYLSTLNPANQFHLKHSTASFSLIDGNHLSDRFSETRIDVIQKPQEADSFTMDCENLPTVPPKHVFLAFQCTPLQIWQGVSQADNTAITASTINALLLPQTLPRKKLLLGVFSYYSRNSTASQRNLIRYIYNKVQKSQSMDIDVRFIVGVPSAPEGMKMLLFEQEIYKDLIVVDVGENMDDGKSFHYFKQIEGMMKEGMIPVYEFVGKCDSDTYINLRGLRGELDNIGSGQQFVGLDALKYGELRQFMFGMFYMMSRDLLGRVAELEIGAEELKLAEDLFMSKVVTGFGSDVEWVSLQFTNREGCIKNPAAPFTRQDIATHWCKKSEEMWRSLLTFEKLYSSE
ncbi:UNVERIFIED_CONTAM: hypothetical protein HDU68_010248 [Siphonaria sp. JEL0065]|nr:hypothetical protein HDU68_010248 [Siphonaria sp. JEL0065]